MPEVTFTNPFSDERAEAEALASSSVGEKPMGHEHHFSRIVPALNERIARLERQGLAAVDRFKGEDRRLLHTRATPSW